MMKIAVRGTNWIGDAVMSEPAMRLLRETLPEARLTLVTRPWAEGIFSDSGLFDEILTMERTGSKISDVRRQVSEIRSRSFDAALLFTNSFESALVMRLAGVPVRMGYAADGRRLLLSHAEAVPMWKETRHESHYYLNIAARFASYLSGSPVAAPEDSVPRIAVSGERREAARAALGGAGVDLDGGFVALGVGSTNSRAKRWPAEHYAAVADMVETELKMRAVLVGGPDETEVAEEVARASRTSPVSFVGKTSLAQITAMLAEADMLVANDMGLAHIAAAAGTPTLTVFGPTKDDTTRPLGKRSEFIRNPVECSPCMLRDCPIDHRCMTGLSPSAVFARMTAMMSGSKGSMVS